MRVAALKSRHDAQGRALELGADGTERVPASGMRLCLPTAFTLPAAMNAGPRHVPLEKGGSRASLHQSDASAEGPQRRIFRSTCNRRRLLAGTRACYT